MSAPTNYARLTASILSLKGYFAKLQNEKYDHFKKAINECQYDSLEESWDVVPDCKELSRILGSSKPKFYKLIKGFYAELMIQFDAKNPIGIKKAVHLIYISVPSDEISEYPNQKYAQEEMYK